MGSYPSSIATRVVSCAIDGPQARLRIRLLWECLGVPLAFDKYLNTSPGIQSLRICYHVSRCTVQMSRYIPPAASTLGRR